MPDFDQPQWTHCLLSVSGPPHELARWKAAFERSPVGLDFMMVLPSTCPEHTPRGITRWRNEHFGFSGALYLRFPRPGEPTTYRFLTRPGPPIAWLRRVAAAWPGLTFTLDYSVGGIREREVRHAAVEDSPQVAGHIGPVALAA